MHDDCIVQEGCKRGAGYRANRYCQRLYKEYIEKLRNRESLFFLLFFATDCITAPGPNYRGKRYETAVMMKREQVLPPSLLPSLHAHLCTQEQVPVRNTHQAQPGDSGDLTLFLFFIPQPEAGPFSHQWSCLSAFFQQPLTSHTWKN